MTAFHSRTYTQFGPLTFGALLGASVGLAIFLFGFYAIRNGDTQRSYQSLLVVAGGGVIVGCFLGFLTEYLAQRPFVMQNPWINQVVRPIAFCTFPYLLVALSMQYYGQDRLMNGLSFWFCCVMLPVIGCVYAVKSKVTSRRDDG